MAKRITGILKLFAMPVAIFLIFSFVAKGFGVHSIPTILSQSVTPVMIGFGLSFLMNAELMDLSMGARTVLAAILGGTMAQSMGIAGLILGCLIGGLAGSVVMALIYRYSRIPMMVVSLGIVMIYEVVGAKITGSSGYLRIDSDVYKVASYPLNLVILLAGGVLCYILYYRTQIGCHITAVGNDEKMCKNVGVNPDRVKFIAIILTGIFCAIAAVLTICYSGAITASTEMGTISMAIKSIICVILGRQMRKVCDCMPLLIGIGGLCVTIIFNGFIAMGFSDSLQDIVLGLFLIIVLGYSANSKVFAEIFKKRGLVKA